MEKLSLLLEKIEEPIKLLNFPNQRQGEKHLCGAVTVQLILEYYGIDYREQELADILKSDPKNGTDIKNIIKFLNLILIYQ